MPIPKGFKTLIENEMEKQGFWNFAEVMGHILKSYFGQSPPSTEGNATDSEEPPNPQVPSQEIETAKPLNRTKGDRNG